MRDRWVHQVKRKKYSSIYWIASCSSSESKTFEYSPPPFSCFVPVILGKLKAYILTSSCSGEEILRKFLYTCTSFIFLKTSPDGIFFLKSKRFSSKIVVSFSVKGRLGRMDFLIFFPLVCY